ncbi:MAG: outer membrane lipoprotein-sorting protein [Deltaproteobacteria bacterium]|nr:outer membrane lipoprotein-sorting protein [Deltaproteobacteria bacterium]
MNVVLRLAASLALVAGALVSSAPAHAEEGPTAEQIAARMVRGTGFQWEGAKTRLRMVLVDAGGARSERMLEVIGRRREGRLESVVKFLGPADVAGTAFLMLEKAGGATEQHIYLPGLKRTRRIVGREREGSFMGSDFTYQDLQRKDDPGAKHQRLPDEPVGSEDAWVLETTPSSVEAAGHSKLRAWVRKTDSVALRTRFFDAAGKPKKTLYVRRIREFEGKPVVVEARMQSEGGHATELVVDTLERKDDLPDSAFTPAALER